MLEFGYLDGLEPEVARNSAVYRDFDKLYTRSSTLIGGLCGLPVDYPDKSYLKLFLIYAGLATPTLVFSFSSSRCIKRSVFSI